MHVASLSEARKLGGELFCGRSVTVIHWPRGHITVVAVIMMLLFARSGEGQTVGAPRCGTGVHETEATGTVAFPQDQIFCALIADPKEPRPFVSFLRGEFRTVDDQSGDDTNIASVGVADTFGFVRWNGSEPGNGVQIDVAGSIFAQFDLGSPSNDLINADYILAFPLTMRRGGFSARARLYHQSSHLGDEFLLRDQVIQRENLSFEAVELILSGEGGPLRVYGGFERLFRREPDTLAPQLMHGGVELRSDRAGAWQMVAGVDVKATEQHDWSPAISGRAGLQVAISGREGHPERLIQFLFEAYEGPSPYGQFFQDDIEYVGFGVQIGF